jgi:predicted Mrr-cat superfamily restriction endonuclease
MNGFVKDEINYKKAIIRDAQEILSENEYKNLLVEENYDEIYNKIRLLINHKQNNLLHYAEKLGDKYLFNDPGYENFVKSAPFCNNLYSFLFDNEDVYVKLEKFLEFLESSNIVLKWTWPTYLLFLYNPENSIFVKPKVFRWFLNLFNLKYSPKPSSALYREILDTVSLVKEMFDVYEPEDMVDIQSLIYVCHGASRENDESDIEEENQSNDLLNEPYQAGSNLISQNFQNIFNFYLAAKTDREIKTKVKVFFKDSERILKRFLYDNFEHYNLKVDHSIGKGRMAEVPWFAFMDTKITTTTRKGVYCAFLFHPNMEGVYLTFMLGAGVYQQQPLTKNDITDISEISAKFRRLDDYVSLRSIGFNVDHNIDLGSQNTTVKAFEQATIAYKYYPKSSLNNDTLLLQDLSNLLEKTLQSFEKPEIQSLIQQMLGNQHDIEESDQPSYWLYSPGENASKWEEFKDEGIIAIGWDGTSDFSSYSTQEELLEELKNIYAGEKDPSMAAKMCFNFYRNMKIGDYVFVREGIHKLIGYVEVTSDYQFDDTRPDFKHVRDVELLKTGEWDVTKDIVQNQLPRHTLLNITGNMQLVNSLKKLVEYKAEELEQVPDIDSDTDLVSVPKNYWWLNANPKIWDMSTRLAGVRQKYTTHNERGNKRNIYKYFVEVQPGDMIIGYMSSPRKEITTLCKVTKPVHHTEDGESIEFEIVEQIQNTINWEEIKIIDELKKSEPVRNNQGSLFKLTPDEFEIIQSLIHDKNPVQEKIFEKYSMEDILNEAFLEEEEIEEIVELLKAQEKYYSPRTARGWQDLYC